MFPVNKVCTDGMTKLVGEYLVADRDVVVEKMILALIKDKSIGFEEPVLFGRKVKLRPV
jgi:hypothetical protein